MFSEAISLEWNGLKITCLREKAIWLEETGMLLISDPHFGKAGHFRRNGIPLPVAGMAEDLRILESLLQKYRPGQLLVLGDLFHSTYNSEWELFREHRRGWQMEVVLVKGNHDILEDRHYASADIRVISELVLPQQVKLLHEPDADESFPVLSGHIHPGVLIPGHKTSFRLPAFWFSGKQALMPAFGSYTGLKPISRQAAEEVFVAVGPGGLFTF